VTPFISHARNHKPAGGPASSRAAAPQWLDVMAHLHNMAPIPAALSKRWQMSVGVVWTPLWTWLALLRSRHPRWSISFKGSRVRGNPYRGAVRMYVSPDGMHANSRAGRLSPSLETSRWDFWRARRFRCGWWFHYLPRFQCSVSSLPLHPDSDDCKCDKEDTNGNHARTHGHPNCGNRSARRLIWWW